MPNYGEGLYLDPLSPQGVAPWAGPMLPMPPRRRPPNFLGMDELGPMLPMSDSGLPVRPAPGGPRTDAMVLPTPPLAFSPAGLPGPGIGPGPAGGPGASLGNPSIPSPDPMGAIDDWRRNTAADFQQQLRQRMEELRSGQRQVSPQVEAMVNAARARGAEDYWLNPTFDRTFWGPKETPKVLSGEERERAMREAVSANFDRLAAEGRFFGGATLAEGPLAPGQSRFVKPTGNGRGVGGLEPGSPEEQEKIAEIAMGNGLVLTTDERGRTGWTRPGAAQPLTAEQKAGIRERREARDQVKAERLARRPFVRAGMIPTEVTISPEIFMAMGNPELAVEMAKVRSTSEASEAQRKMAEALAQRESADRRYEIDQRTKADMARVDLDREKMDATLNPSDRLRYQALRQAGVPHEEAVQAVYDENKAFGMTAAPAPGGIAPPPAVTLNNLVPPEVGEDLRQQAESLSAPQMAEYLARQGYSNAQGTQILRELYKNRAFGSYSTMGGPRGFVNFLLSPFNAPEPGTELEPFAGPGGRPKAVRIPDPVRARPQANWMGR